MWANERSIGWRSEARRRRHWPRTRHARPEALRDRCRALAKAYRQLIPLFAPLLGVDTQINYAHTNSFVHALKRGEK